MAIQPQSRTTFPVRPFAILGVAMIGLAIGVVAVRWDRSDSGGSTTATTASTALPASISPAPLTGFEALQAELAAHEAWTEAQFGPLIRPTVPYDVVAAALAEHDNAITASLGTGLVLTASTTSGRTYDEELADALAQHDAAFPPIPTSSVVLEPGTLATASTVSGRNYDEELAAALAQHDADFPPLAASENPYVADR